MSQRVRTALVKFLHFIQSTTVKITSKKIKPQTKKSMNNIDWAENNERKDLAKQDSYSMEQLEAMQLVAKMKEAADKCGAGFIGGFISPTGERFMMTNQEQDSAQVKAINKQLDQVQNLQNLIKLDQKIASYLEELDQ
jgi:DNA mismatch repair ATPase MutS